MLTIASITGVCWPLCYRYGASCAASRQRPGHDTKRMVRPTRIQVVQIAVLSVGVFVGIKVLFPLLVFGFTVLTGMWTDRP